MFLKQLCLVQLRYFPFLGKNATKTWSILCGIFGTAQTRKSSHIVRFSHSVTTDEQGLLSMFVCLSFI